MTIPGIGKLAQKGTNGALPIDQAGLVQLTLQTFAQTSVWEVAQRRCSRHQLPMLLQDDCWLSVGFGEEIQLQEHLFQAALTIF